MFVFLSLFSVVEAIRSIDVNEFIHTATSSSSSFSAGVAKIDSTPPIGVPLAGYNHGARRVPYWPLPSFAKYTTWMTPSKGRLPNDGIFVRSLVMKDSSGTAIAMTTLDGIGSDGTLNQMAYDLAVGLGFTLPVTNLFCLKIVVLLILLLFKKVFQLHVSWITQSQWSWCDFTRLSLECCASDRSVGARDSASVCDEYGSGDGESAATDATGALCHWFDTTDWCYEKSSWKDLANHFVHDHRSRCCVVANRRRRDRSTNGDALEFRHSWRLLWS